VRCLCVTGGIALFEGCTKLGILPERWDMDYALRIHDSILLSTRTPTFTANLDGSRSLAYFLDVAGGYFTLHLRGSVSGHSTGSNASEQLTSADFE